MASSESHTADKASAEHKVKATWHGSQTQSADTDEAVELSELLQHRKPKLLTKRMFRLYGILLLGYMCIILQGYDGSLMGAINAMVCWHLLGIMSSTKLTHL